MRLTQHKVLGVRPAQVRPQSGSGKGVLLTSGQYFLISITQTPRDLLPSHPFLPSTNWNAFLTVSLHPLCFSRCWAYTTRWTLRRRLRPAVSPRTWSHSLSCTMLGGPPKWSSSPTWWWNPASAAERHLDPPKAKRETVSTHSPAPRLTQKQLGVRDYIWWGPSAKPCGLGSDRPWGSLLEHFLVLLALSRSFWELLWLHEGHAFQNGWTVGAEEKDRVEELLCIWMLDCWSGRVREWERAGQRGNGNGEMFSILALPILGLQPSPLAWRIKGFPCRRKPWRSL